MMVVTGGAGFVGANVVRALNRRGRDDILVVDDLTDGRKFTNLVDCEILDYWDREEFSALLDRDGELDGAVEAVFHQGACAVTTEWDGRYMMRNNHRFSRLLLEWCRRRNVPFLYASSAAVYGSGSVFREDPACEAPLNVYGYSKLLFDRHVRRVLRVSRSQVVGLRYFNVYGPREAHKGAMASVAWHFRGQALRDGRVRLFEGSDGYADGEQCRDFVHVDDVVDVNLWFLDHPERSGIFNVGTGRAETFNEVARAVLRWRGSGEIEYIPFPAELRGRYQSRTEADISALRVAGYEAEFKSVRDGVARYMEWLDRAQSAAPAVPR